MDVSTQRNSRLWYVPAIMAGSFMMAFAAVLWLIHQNTSKTRQNELVSNAESASGTIRLRLAGNADYLLMLAQERAGGALGAESFQERGSRFVADHPEMICINWVDADFRITDVAPLAPNRQIVGLRLELPEPKRASQLAGNESGPFIPARSWSFRAKSPWRYGCRSFGARSFWECSEASIPAKISCIT